jgi:hypothetical protein
LGAGLNPQSNLRKTETTARKWNDWYHCLRSPGLWPPSSVEDEDLYNVRYEPLAGVRGGYRPCSVICRGRGLRGPNAGSG